MSVISSLVARRGGKVGGRDCCVFFPNERHPECLEGRQSFQGFLFCLPPLHQTLCRQMLCQRSDVCLCSCPRRILLNYAVFNPDMGYCQGMSDLVAPLLTEIQDESDTFWCFVGLMENTIFISSPRDEDMERQLVGGSCRRGPNLQQEQNESVPCSFITFP